MGIDLVQIHHASYQEDIPFWTSLTEDRDPILEIGCGHGRVTLPLLERGRQVVGVDRDKQALDFLKQSLNAARMEIQARATLVEGDILEYDSDLSFGAVLIPCNTISTFQPANRKALFSKVKSLLKPNGLLAASLPNPVLLLQQLADLRATGGESELELETIFSHPTTGFPVQVSSRIAAVGSALKWEWIYDQLYPEGQVKRTVVTTEHYPTPLYTYLDELSEAGFKSSECLGDFQGSPYTNQSPYLIMRVGC